MNMRRIVFPGENSNSKAAKSQNSGIRPVYSHISRYTSARAYGEGVTRSTGT
jgi:hypothetical protein